MAKNHFASWLTLVAGALAVTCQTVPAYAVSSAEMYTSKSYYYGRFVARIQFAPGDGVVSSFFLWKDGSEKSGTFWNELDFEKLGADCHLETNAYYGNPAVVHSKKQAADLDLCGGFHTYAYEWTPDYIAWSVDGNEIRRESGEAATAYSDNATAGMQIRFNIWPGDASFGGTFSPSILPVYEYINWVEYYSYADGDFNLEWREDFDGKSVPSGWLRGSWDSPKGLSKHNSGNVKIVDGYAVLSLTDDDALGAGSAAPADTEESDPTTDSEGAGGTSGTDNSETSEGLDGVGASSSTSRSSAGGTEPGSSVGAMSSAAQRDNGGGCTIKGGHDDQRGGLHVLLLAAAGVLLGLMRRSRSRIASRQDS